MIDVTRIKADPSDHRVDLQVSASGMTISVEAGSFRFGRNDYELLEDFTYAAAESPDARDVRGMLAVERECGRVVLVVDETDVGVEYQSFGWKNSKYDRIVDIFRFRIPGGATSFDEVPIMVRRIV